MKYICMLLPAFLASSKEIKAKDNWIKKIAILSKNCLIINLVFMMILIATGKTKGSFDASNSVSFYTLYLFVGLVLAKILPIVIDLIKDNIDIKIERKKK